MKELLMAFAVIIAAPLLAQPAPPSTRVILMWDNPIENRTNHPAFSTNITYRVWNTNALPNFTNTATTNWSLLTTLPNNTNAATMGVILTINPSTANFFAVSASNFFESFSTNVWTPPSPSALVNLRVSLTN